jgi:hypothetical protein
MSSVPPPCSPDPEKLTFSLEALLDKAPAQIWDTFGISERR